MEFVNTDPCETRAKILNSALELFSAKGYDSSSISEICKKAEITKGALYWYFKDKLALYKELINVVLKGVIQEANELENEADSPLERLRMFNKSLLHLMQTRDFYQKSLLMFLRELRTERVADLHASLEILDEEYNFEKDFVEAIEAKELNNNLSSSEYLDLYKSTVASLVINWLVKGKKFDLCSKGEKYFEYMFRLDLEKEKK
jgi:TetR/AcrR family acrAB operon transcriptional repressor